MICRKFLIDKTFDRTAQESLTPIQRLASSPVGFCSEGSKVKLQLSGVLSIAAIACASVLGATPVFAQGTWTGAGAGSTCDGGSASYVTLDCTKNSITATLTAYGYNNTLSTTAQAGFQQGRLGDFDAAGFGAYTGTNESGTDAQHAFDNVTTAGSCGSGSGAGASGSTLMTINTGCGGAIEALLISFNGKVKLTQLTTTSNFGTAVQDADLSIYRWDSDTPLTMASGQTASTVGNGTLAGWTLVGSNDMDASGNIFNTGGNQYSSYFLITTYFGTTNAGLGLDAGNDRFKITSFTASTCARLSGTGGNGSTCAASVPEPMSLALVGVALLGATAARRRYRTRG